MRVEVARPGALLVDSEAFSVAGTLQEAQALRASGVDGVFVYLGAITAERVGFCHQAGMAVIPVTFGLAPSMWDPQRDLERTVALGIPLGRAVHPTIFLDVEGERVMPASTPFATTKAAAENWGRTAKSAGAIPGGYFGSPQPFTSLEMWELPFERYWRGQGRIVDRSYQHSDGAWALAEPAGCGWCMTQSYPSHAWRGGLLCDAQIVSQDYLGRAVTWVVGT